MAKLDSLIIDKYRSINHVELFLPNNAPLVLIGENNAGKSNIVKAIDLILGETWPTSHDPDTHEFYLRDPSQRIYIEASFSQPLGRWRTLIWEYNPANSSAPISFEGVDESGNRNKYIKREERTQLTCVTVSSDRRLDYQLSYATKMTMLSKLMHRFHQTLQASSEIKTNLEGKFVEIKNLFHQIDEFKTFRDSLRDDLSGLASVMTHKLDVDFEAYNPTNFFHALRLQTDEKGIPRTFEELGTGEQQILALSFAHAYAKAFHGGVLLAIEEPEAHLHPLAQDWLAYKVMDMARDGLQIVVETHNPSFIHILNLPGLASIRKEQGAATRAIQLKTEEFARHCIECGAPPDKTRVENILEFYQANSSKEILEGFFAKKIVLVEGPTESMALPIYFRKLGLDVQKEGIAIIPVHGKGSIARWWRMFTAYEIPTYVIFDNDPQDDASGAKRQDILQTIGETEIEAILASTDLIVKDLCAVFGTDFETCLRNLFSCYDYISIEQEAENFIQSGAKPFKARYTANKICANCDTEDEAWARLKELKEKIKSCKICLESVQEQNQGANEPNDIPF